MIANFWKTQWGRTFCSISQIMWWSLSYTVGQIQTSTMRPFTMMSMRFVEKFSKTMFLFRCQARPTTFLDVENCCCSYSQNRKASLVKLLEVVAHTPPPQRVKQYQDTIALISYTILEMIGFVSQVFSMGSATFNRLNNDPLNFMSIYDKYELIYPGNHGDYTNNFRK